MSVVRDQELKANETHAKGHSVTNSNWRCQRPGGSPC